MSERTIASGSDFMCFVRTGTQAPYTYKPIAGQTNCTLQRDQSNRETSAKNSGYPDFFLGKKGWSASVEIDVTDPSDTNANEVSFDDLQTYEEAGSKPTFAFCWITALTDSTSVAAPDTTKPMYVGVGLVSCPLNAPANENMKSTVAIQGCRKLTKVAGTPST